MRSAWTLTVLLGVSGAASAQDKKVIQLPGAPEGLPFSTAVQVGNVLYLSGQVGTSPETRQLVPGGITAEVRQTLENIKRTLEQAGSSMERVFKCTVFLVDINDFNAMNEVYRTYFPKDPPARSTVAGSGLALGARAEIECLAAQEKQAIQPGAMLSAAVRVENLLYLSGQLGTDPGTRQLAPGGIAAETRQALENIKRLLGQNGSSMERVTKCTVFLADIADYGAMNEVYRTYFPKDPPARSTVAVKGLVRDARVEIECIALAAA